MRRQFNQTYEQTITLIKQLKNSNDYLNRAIGVESNTNISLRLKRQKSLIDSNIAKIDSLVRKLEQSYLDPDTARKIGTVKQQFRIQKDRRKDLLVNAELDQQMQENIHITPVHPRENIRTNFQPICYNNSRQPHQNGSTWNRSTHHKDTESTARTEGSYNQHHREQPLGLSYEFQHKIMKQRNDQINNVSRTLLNVHSVIQETGAMVHEQGEKLDIIGEELFQAYKNANAARDNMVEANQQQRRSKRKYVYFSLVVLLGVAVTVFILML